jgi:hypothetical protein
MGFNSGSIKYNRFRVIGDAPRLVDESTLEKFAALALSRRDETTAEVDYGWCGGAHVLDGEFSVGHNVYNGCLFVGLRVDTNRVPPALKSAYFALEVKAHAENNPSGFASRGQKREAKDTAGRKIDEDLASGKHRKHALHEVLWDLDNQYLYAGVSGTKAEQLMELFERTTGFTLQLESSSVVALDYVNRLGRRRDLEDAKPTPFGLSPTQQVAWAEYPWIAKGSEAAHDYLGNEFALWLTWMAGKQDRIETPIGLATLMVARGVDLQCSYGENGKDTIRASHPFEVPETIIAIGHGKMPRRLGLTLAIVSNLYSMTLQPEQLAVAGLKLPEIDKADSPRVLFEERITMLRDFVKCLDAMFESFLALRLSADWSGQQAMIGEWIAGKPRKVPNDFKFSRPEPEAGERVSARGSVTVEQLGFETLSVEQVDRMRERRIAFFRRTKGDADQRKLVNELWAHIRAENQPDETLAATTVRLARKALEQDGNLMKQDGLIFAFMEQAEPTQKPMPVITKGMAKAMKGLVSGIGDKGGLESITMSTNIPGCKPVTIDAEGAKRVRRNCDHVIAGGTLKRVEPEVSRSTEAEAQRDFDAAQVYLICANLPAATIDKLPSAGITTGAKLRDAFDNHKFRPIQGIAAKTWEKIGEAMSDWMIARSGLSSGGDQHEKTAGKSTNSGFPVNRNTKPAKKNVRSAASKRQPPKPKKAEPMPDASAIDQPPATSTNDPPEPTDVRPLFHIHPRSRLWAEIGRRGDAWAVQGGCSIGGGAIRQEEDWPWFERATRAEAIEHLETLIGDFLESAGDSIDATGETHVRQVKAAVIALAQKEETMHASPKQLKA